MRTGGGFLRFVKNTFLVMAGVTLFLGLVAYSQGAMIVYVRQKNPDRFPIFLPIPALLVTETVGFIPPRELRKASRDLRQWLPAIQAASRELQQVPDGVLVEVTNPRERVLISKQGDDLLINVDDEAETVRLSFPVNSLSSIAERLASQESPI
jgi:hypothetical protein